MKAKDIIKTLDKLCSPKLIDSWDNTGFQIGNDQKDIKRILIALDLDEYVINKAIDEKYHMIISHHPLIFKPLKNINNRSYLGNMILKLIENKIVVYNAHSNLDLAIGGVNDKLAELLGINNPSPLNKIKKEKLYKLVVYVPEDSRELILRALEEEDAGHIGNYSSCTFNTKGIGTFRPLEGTNPFIGVTNILEEVNEVKVETIVKEEALNRTINKVIKIHPYEEVAYDIFELINEGYNFGYGRVGDIEEVDALNFIMDIKEKLNLDHINIYGNLDKKIKRVAVCGGSGGDFIEDAYNKGAQIYITGDIKYHQAQLADQLGMIICDAGHYHTEKVALDVLKDFILKEIDEVQVDISLKPGISHRVL
ncbi:Nif3-like dinuclear metal center hexameric protein [Tissierella creatinini]|nr:Nif3-like dinuclear metal center hexameric protein [Tissierella creatinini]TJX67153.1 Nif3-like dinuclear metal center hexameric protein [Soehngenia saccharolytica]